MCQTYSASVYQSLKAVKSSQFSRIILYCIDGCALPTITNKQLVKLLVFENAGMSNCSLNVKNDKIKSTDSFESLVVTFSVFLPFNHYYYYVSTVHYTVTSNYVYFNLQL